LYKVDTKKIHVSRVTK